MIPRNTRYGNIAKLALMVALLSIGSLVSAQEPAQERKAFRVCAPPHNMPLSTKAEEGWENKIAQLFAGKLGLPLEYVWFPQRIGFIRNTLRFNNNADESFICDIVIGVIDNFELAATTKPYLRSSWTMVYVKGRGLDFIKSQADLKNLTDEQKSILRIGLWDKGPAPDYIYLRGLMDYATPYQMMSGDTERNAGRIIEEDLIEDKINLTFVWGPIAGYYAKQIKDHEVVVSPMKNELRIPFEYQISMAVRHGEKQWKEQINGLIDDNQDEINKILDEYGVPRLPVVMREFEDDDDD